VSWKAWETCVRARSSNRPKTRLVGVARFSSSRPLSVLASPLVSPLASAPCPVTLTLFPTHLPTRWMPRLPPTTGSRASMCAGVLSLPDRALSSFRPFTDPLANHGPQLYPIHIHLTFRKPLRSSFRTFATLQVQCGWNLPSKMLWATF
jgi:hypothetical protein